MVEEQAIDQIVQLNFIQNCVYRSLISEFWFQSSFLMIVPQFFSIDTEHNITLCVRNNLISIILFSKRSESFGLLQSFSRIPLHFRLHYFMNSKLRRNCAGIFHTIGISFQKSIIQINNHNVSLYGINKAI